MKSILVTGANGFIGSALIESLESFGFNIIKFNSSDGDISNYNFLKKYENMDIDHIFHLAAKTFVPDSWENPLEFYKTSVLGTGQILELCRHKNIPLTFISAYLYGLPEKLPISEDDKVKSNNPYAHSKYLSEELCRFYSEYYNVKVTIARPFNIYGKNQKDMFLIPYIIKQVLNDDVINVKDLYPKRDYIYLDDLIDGLVKTIENKKQFSIYNFGSGSELSVQEIIDIIQKIAGTKKEIISEKQERPNEIMNVIADITKAKYELGWEPKFSFEKGIKYIIEDLNNVK
ncbi:NAD-dependent epimerase/dehydratase family protein [Aliarcobacter butzleri]|uniref:NAD-dependent epimerase/dehydratase family protein n=1 Tax=Aliarcobacter butzleri TaxID=28197 RepID=UPI0021B29200|nr:NAD(P)-dependent oxidoreductase [Aliarcobacter butzleri]MCT7605864.1 NAD(P)-dependent oxidoreductase [Aliarcobacter butzleri]MCT7608133.1 NAD(P)-dependent oxidoreductase [Aliarcobacter butzleri]